MTSQQCNSCASTVYITNINQKFTPQNKCTNYTEASTQEVGTIWVYHTCGSHTFNENTPDMRAILQESTIVQVKSFIIGYKYQNVQIYSFMITLEESH